MHGGSVQLRSLAPTYDLTYSYTPSDLRPDDIRS